MNSANKITLRLAKRSDVDRILKFYQEHWRKGHIIANQKEYLLYEHLDDDRVNFIIGTPTGSDDIFAAVGFTDYGGYAQHRHVTSTMLCVSGQCKVPFLGIELIRSVKELTHSFSYCGVTTNPVTVAPYVKRFMKHQVAEFDHYYIANPDEAPYKLLIEGAGLPLDREVQTDVCMVEVYNFIDILSLECTGRKLPNLPYKSLAYLNKRYFSHPIFKYRFFICRDKLKGDDAILIARVETLQGKSVLRIVDYIGPLSMMDSISWCIHLLIRQEGHEYCDLFCTNAAAFLSEAGCFVNRRVVGSIVPHYFHPYIQKNIDVLYETDTPENIYFKGDGDGDRPNFY